MINPKKIAGLESFAHLWDTQNPDWLKQRKADWAHIRKNNLPKFSASDLREYGAYFVYGNRESYINWVSLYTMTPFTTPEQAHSVFYSPMFDAKERSDIFKFFLGRAERTLNGIPWVRSHCLSFISGVMGQTYSVVTETEEMGGIEILSDTPSRFIERFFKNLKRVMKGALETNYTGYMDCFDYLFSCFLEVQNLESFERLDLVEFYRIVDIIIEYEGQEITEYSKEVALALKVNQNRILNWWNALETAVD